ncbi:hypothetical protein [Asticcacaulis machinosus]|uniref:Flagellar hook-length control protein FliK n=1 Tax=Asticcacaulis machinosus TaxID=2984211 RepID=A0ABT5HLL2_9CAUL|nr:hypothetical protein [Asticcacaulis machinosus]MDC7677067.1 hypothetical protein [Asticcacaulis machinosus]
MATPIRPSLADALRARPNVGPAPAAPANAETARLDAQRAFFQKALGNTSSQPTANTPATIAPARTQVQPAVTPANFKAADVASNTGAENLTPLRPGSLLNIIV